MVVEFGDSPTLERIERVLRRTLHDPTLVIATWSRAAGGFLDRDGGPVTPPVGDPDRTVTALERGGDPLVAIIHDPSVLEEPGLLAAASAALRLTLENEDLAGRLRREVADVRGLPSGRVTFLLTDIEGSTDLLHRLGDRWAPVLAEQRGLVAAIVRRGRGHEVDARADEYFAVFEEAADAIASALAIQRRMRSHAWPDGAELRLRVGIHTGEPELTDAGYVGVDVHLAARVCAAGHGGQILLTEPARMALGDALPPDADLLALGPARLRGIPDPMSLYQLVVPDLPSAFPPLRLGS
jgi:class 3 adenylate cyclase